MSDNKDLKDEKKLQDEELDQVSGGTGRETNSGNTGKNLNTGTIPQRPLK